MKLDQMSGFAEELRTLFRIRYGGPDAEEAMCRELIELNKLIWKLEKRIELLEQDRHRAFYREAPRVIPVSGPIDVPPNVEPDDWIETGKDNSNE